MAVKIRDSEGSWVFICPVSNLELSAAVDYEYRIDGLTVVASKSLPYRRRRFGFPERISELKKRPGPLSWKFLSDAKTYAIIRFTGRPSDREASLFQKVRDELAILALSQLGYAKRHQIAYPSLSDEYRPGRRSYLVKNTKNKSWYQPNEVTGKFLPLVLDDGWVEFSRRVFFNDYLRIIREKASVKGSWRQALRTAGILCGQSQCENDKERALLLDLIALEILLTRREDRLGETLSERVEAFIGWTDFWESEDYSLRIRDLYKKRSDFVHRGQRGKVTWEDVYLADDILLNVITNLVCHSKLFQSKDDVISFSTSEG